MNDKPIDLADIRRHIKKCKKKGVRFDWLRFTENKDLTPAVEALFQVCMPDGRRAGWNWVSGNAALKLLEETIS